MKDATAAGVVLLFSCVASLAHAQPAPRAGGFVNVNAGIQEGSQRLTLSVPVEVFGTSGTLDVDDGLIGGALFDVSGGVRGPGFAFGAGFSHSRTSGSSNFTASTIPASAGSFTRSIKGITPELEHSERAVYVFAAVSKQVTRRVDLTLSGGPAFLHVRQDVPAAITLNASGSTVLNMSTATEDESTVGVYGGLDFNYMFHRHIGIGAVARYMWGSVDLPNSTDSMTLGGLQVGAGVRMRF